MRDNRSVARFTPITPRSRRLGTELRKLREAAGLTLEAAGKATSYSGARIGRIELGEIKPRPGDVFELLRAYGVDLESEQARELGAASQALRAEQGWWQRTGSLSTKYQTYIAFEEEATGLRHYEPTLVPALLQTTEYARAVVSLGRETDAEAIETRVKARLRRQELLTRKTPPARLHAVVTEAALRIVVGDADILAAQHDQIIRVARLPNVTVQVLTFAAGQHHATYGGFTLLDFDEDGPTLGYVENVGGELFLEAHSDIALLTRIFNSLTTLALSPAESIKFIKERSWT